MDPPVSRRIGEEPVSLQYFFLKKFQLIGTEGTRLLREKRVEGDPTVARSAEGGPPAESECLEWKSLQIPSFRNPLPFRRLKNHPRTPNPILFRQTETMESISVFFCA
ncbi:hypothetical protein DOZ91_11200 [Peribacillus frigoritolerans]|nr:hypothetical protein DOZ91_11200 [Peribacillus frigoritolerans]